MNFKLNFIEPRVWEVKEGEDGLVYCEGKYREESTFMEFGELIDTPGVALVVLKDKKTEA
jgi:hypothetical protein